MTDTATAPAKRRWTIDVCRTCDRLAQWPFCPHRDEWLAAHPVGSTTGPAWYQPVVVQEVHRRRD